MHSLDSSVEEIHGFDTKDKQQAKARAQEFTQALMLETEGVLGNFYGFEEEEQTEREVRKENLSPKERKRRKAVARGKKSRD